MTVSSEFVSYKNNCIENTWKSNCHCFDVKLLSFFQRCTKGDCKVSEFNISIFIKTMQSGLAEDNKQEAAGRLLLDSVAKQNSVLVDVDGKMITNLVKRKAPVHDAIRTAAAKPEVIEQVIEYYKEIVVKKLNPHTFADACLEILKILERDATVSMEKYNELKELYDKCEIGEFLALCCLYALCRPNKLEETPVDYSDLPLLSEVNNECPLCHSPLVKNIKGKTVKKYKIINIFPGELELEKEAEFIAARTPVKRLDSNDNKIALCEDCSESHELDPEVDEYIMLSDLKQRYTKSYAMQQEIAKLDLEDDIRDVIEALTNLKSVGG